MRQQNTVYQVALKQPDKTVKIALRSTLMGQEVTRKIKVWLAFVSLSQNKRAFSGSDNDYPFDPLVSIFALLIGKTRPKVDQAVFSPACLINPSLSLFSCDEMPSGLLDAVFNGEEAIAKHMLDSVVKANNLNRLKAVLSTRGTATDYAGRTIVDHTLLQAAVSTRDEQMCVMLEFYFACLPNGQALKYEQLKEIVKRSLEFYACNLQTHQEEIAQALESDDLLAMNAAHDKAQVAYSTIACAALLNPIKEAIVNTSKEDIEAAKNLEEDNTSALCNTNLPVFRKACEQLFNHGEPIVNVNHMVNAYAMRDDEHSWPINVLDVYANLFWQQVIGFMQRFMSANVAQAFAYGIGDIVENDHQCPRSFDFRNWNVIARYDGRRWVDEFPPVVAYFPLDDFQLGFQFSIDPIKGRVVFWRQIDCNNLTNNIFKPYIQQKHQIWKTYVRIVNSSAGASACNSHTVIIGDAETYAEVSAKACSAVYEKKYKEQSSRAGNLYFLRPGREAHEYAEQHAKESAQAYTKIVTETVVAGGFATVSIKKAGVAALGIFQSKNEFADLDEKKCSSNSVKK